MGLKKRIKNTKSFKEFDLLCHKYRVSASHVVKLFIFTGIASYLIAFAIFQLSVKAAG